VENWWVYIVKKNGKFYTGITTDLGNRMRQHGESTPAYTEGPMSRKEAVNREKQIKKWSREKKMQLISKGTGKLR
jgi:predicted GIY-YIG superfamily endonuclease